MAIKTNLLYDATTTLNMGVEFRLSNKTSLDVSANWNPVTFSDNRKWKHVLAQPEFRLWTKETFRGHFFGLHAHYAYYNISNLPKSLFSQNMKDNRYEGWLAGAGVGYGYRRNFSRRWGLETVIGLGYTYLGYDKYKCGTCGEKLSSNKRNYFGPTKAAITLVYNFGCGKKVSFTPVSVYVHPVEIKEVAPLVAPLHAPVYAVSYLTPEAEEVKARSHKGSASLDFASGQADIATSAKSYTTELQHVYELITQVKNEFGAKMTGLTITGYASPEGTYYSNLILSRQRANAVKNHIQSVYGFPGSFFLVEGRGEDWMMLDSLVAQSSMVDKSRILEIIRNIDIFDGREKKLMELSGGAPYRQMLNELFPKLRRSDYVLHYTVDPFTVEEGKEVLKTKPSNLSLNEMFLIAKTYKQGSDAFNEVFEKAAQLFPHNDTANLNAAASALERGDKMLTGHYLAQVSEKGRNAAWHNNTAILHSLQGEYDQSTTEFNRAISLGSEQAVQNINLLYQYVEQLKMNN